MGVEIVKVDEKVVRECKMVQETEVDLLGLRSGVYFLRVEGPGIDEMKRVLLLR